MIQNNSRYILQKRPVRSIQVSPVRFWLFVISELYKPARQSRGPGGVHRKRTKQCQLYLHSVNPRQDQLRVSLLFPVATISRFSLAVIAIKLLVQLSRFQPCSDWRHVRENDHKKEDPDIYRHYQRNDLSSRFLRRVSMMWSVTDQA